MELNLHALETYLNEEEIKEVEKYYETNKSGILKELEEPDHNISLRPLAIIFEEPREELQNEYHSLIFSKSDREDGVSEVNVELVK